MKKTPAIIAASILFLLSALEIARWIYVAENATTMDEAKAKYFAPYPAALQNNTISTWILFICLTAAATVFFANWKRGMLFRVTGIFAALLAFWMLFSLM